MRYEKQNWNNNYDWDYKNYQSELRRWKGEGINGTRSRWWSKPTPPPSTWEEYRDQRLSWGWQDDRYREDSYVSVTLLLHLCYTSTQYMGRV